MKFYIKQNKVLFVATILVSVIASLGYVFMAILLQQLLDIAVGKDMQQFIRMVLFSIFYFAVLGIFLYLQSLLSKKVICKIMRQIRSDVFRGTVNHSIEDFKRRHQNSWLIEKTRQILTKKAGRKMIKIMIQKETLISAVSSTVSFLIMLIGALTHTLYIVLVICMFLNLQMAIKYFLKGISIEKKAG